jgi:hypothetical protein
LQSLFGQQSKSHSNGESLSYQGQKKAKNKNENNSTTTTTTADLMLKGPVVVDSFVFDTTANKYNPMGKAGENFTTLKLFRIVHK